MTAPGWDIASGPGVTALGLAAARSVETGRPDRLIDDPLARRLFESSPAAAELPMRLDWPRDGEAVSATEALHLHGSRYIGLRTRFYDEFVLAGGAEQVVLLGAGLDTRPHRLAADVRWFELDQPEVLAYKAAVLGPGGTAVGIDLREDWPGALLAAGFDAGLATAWTAEGLLPYLDAAAQVELIERVVASSAPGSRFAFDRIVGDPTAGGRARALSERAGIDMEALFAGGRPPELAEVLGRHGWKVSEEPVGDVARRYGRDLADPFGCTDAAEPPWLDTIFLTATAGAPT